MKLQTHYDGYTMLKAGLDPSVFLQLHSAYDDAAETQAYTNLQFGLNLPSDMLTGCGQYTASQNP